MLLPRFDTSSVSLTELIQAPNRLSSEVPHSALQNAETKRIARGSTTKSPVCACAIDGSTCWKIG